MSRPEQVAPADVFYGEEEAKKTEPQPKQEEKPKEQTQAAPPPAAPAPTTSAAPPGTLIGARPLMISPPQSPRALDPTGWSLVK